jgi:hypothetical protein
VEKISQLQPHKVLNLRQTGRKLQKIPAHSNTATSHSTKNHINNPSVFSQGHKVNFAIISSVS